MPRAPVLQAAKSVHGERQDPQVEQERSHELFSEWGHRWFDLKRTGRATAALGTKSGWSTHDLLLPLPEMEMKNNPALAPQNPGY